MIEPPRPVITKFLHLFECVLFLLILILFYLLSREALAQVSVHHPKQPSQGPTFSVCLFSIYAQDTIKKQKVGFMCIIAGYSQDKEAEYDEYFFKQKGK